MAKKGSTTMATAAAATAAAPAALNIVALQRVNAATLAGGHDFVTQSEGEALVTAGLITINPEIVNTNGGVAAITTDAGKALVAEQSDDSAQANAAAKSKFEIDDNVPLAQKRGGGGGGSRESIYPFDALNVGQSFHLPATEAMPKPNRTIASAVSQATAKYAVEVKDANGAVVMEAFERKDKAGNVIETGNRPKMQNTRVFTIRAVGSEDPRGVGARIYRTA